MSSKTTTQTNHNKTIRVAILGNIFEYYDLGLCGFFAPVISTSFLPTENKVVLLLSSMIFFASGFIMRPIGAVIFGYIGDVIGRKISLSHTMFIMASTMFCISLLPTYQDIGILAPILLILCRLVQGVCVGGECNNVAIFILETIPMHRINFYSSLVTASAMIGFFIASGMWCIISMLDTLSGFLWRLPFFFGACIGIIGYYFRKKIILESPYFQRHNSTSFLSGFKSNKLGFLRTISIGWLSGVLALTLVAYIPNYLSFITNYSKFQISLASNLGLIVYVVLIPFFGLLADRITSERVMIYASILTIPGSFFIFRLLPLGIYNIYIGVLLLGVLSALFLAPMHAYMANLFPPSFRCRGTSIAFSLGVGILGSTTPIISTFLIQTLKFNEAPALYFIISSIVFLGLNKRILQKEFGSLISLVLKKKETKSHFRKV